MFDQNKNRGDGECLRIRAFTLVELLIVITVIAVMIAMLLPSLSSARSVANATVCLSQTRQLANACLNYASDSKEALPRYDSYAGNPYSTPVWAMLAGQYLSRGPMITVLDDVIGPQTNVLTIPGMKCPGEPQDHVVNAPGWNVNLPVVNGRFRNGLAGQVNTSCGPPVWDVSYAPIGYKFFSHYQFASAHSTYSILNYPGTAPIAVNDGLLTSNQPHVKLSAIVDPGDTWLAFDGNDYRFSAGSAIFRHVRDRANYSYADGHAQGLGMSDVDGNSIYTNLVRDRRGVIER